LNLLGDDFPNVCAEKMSICRISGENGNSDNLSMCRISGEI
jgi:hypothetical protein